MKQNTITLTSDERNFLLALLKKTASEIGMDHVCGEDDAPMWQFFPDPSYDAATVPSICTTRPKDGKKLLNKIKALKP